MAAPSLSLLRTHLLGGRASQAEGLMWHVLDGVLLHSREFHSRPVARGTRTVGARSSP